MKNLTFGFFLICISLHLKSQNSGLINNPNNLPSTINGLLKSETTDSWTYLKDSLYVYPDSLFTKYKSYWGLGLNDSIACIEILTDDISGVHYTYKQYHKGIEVYPLIMRVHDYVGKGLVANGQFARDLDFNINSIISDSIAKINCSK